MQAAAEFKFACPVCHQHLLCDASAAGSQIQCPTCFREITIPPRSHAGTTTKLILRGTHVKPQTRFREPAPRKKSLFHFRKAALLIALVSGLAWVGALFAVNHAGHLKEIHAPGNQIVHTQPIL